MFQGKITCANVLSDLYAMGVVDCDNMLMLLGVCDKLSEKERDIVIPLIMKGFQVSTVFVPLFCYMCVFLSVLLTMSVSICLPLNWMVLCTSGPTLKFIILQETFFLFLHKWTKPRWLGPVVHRRVIGWSIAF